MNLRNTLRNFLNDYKKNYKLIDGLLDEMLSLSSKTKDSDKLNSSLINDYLEEKNLQKDFPKSQFKEHPYISKINLNKSSTISNDFFEDTQQSCKEDSFELSNHEINEKQGNLKVRQLEPTSKTFTQDSPNKLSTDTNNLPESSIQSKEMPTSIAKNQANDFQGETIKYCEPLDNYPELDLNYKDNEIPTGSKLIKLIVDEGRVIEEIYLTPNKERVSFRENQKDTSKTFNAA